MIASMGTHQPGHHHAAVAGSATLFRVASPAPGVAKALTTTATTRQSDTCPTPASSPVPQAYFVMKVTFQSYVLFRVCPVLHLEPTTNYYMASSIQNNLSKLDPLSPLSTGKETGEKSHSGLPRITDNM